MSKRFRLTADEAISVLAKGDTVHTFAQVGGLIIGADWDRADVEKHIRDRDGAQLAGEMATRMGHGLCIDPLRPLFAATDPDALAALEAQLANEPAGGAP